MKFSPAIFRLVGDQYTQLAEEALSLTVFNKPVMDLTRAELVLLVAWLFRRLRAADEAATSALPVGGPVDFRPSVN